jgi:hypothetical protein
MVGGVNAILAFRRDIRRTGGKAAKTVATRPVLQPDRSGGIKAVSSQLP